MNPEVRSRRPLSSATEVRGDPDGPSPAHERSQIQRSSPMKHMAIEMVQFCTRPVPRMEPRWAGLGLSREICSALGVFPQALDPLDRTCLDLDRLLDILGDPMRTTEAVSINFWTHSDIRSGRRGPLWIWAPQASDSLDRGRLSGLLDSLQDSIRGDRLGHSTRARSSI